jgi:hypothetical protein
MNTPSNRLPTGKFAVPTAFQPPCQHHSNSVPTTFQGAVYQPPYNPRRLEAAFSGPRGHPVASPANTRAPKSTPARINKRIEKR